MGERTSVHPRSITPRKDHHEKRRSDQDARETEQWPIDQCAQGNERKTFPDTVVQTVVRTTLENAIDGQEQRRDDQTGTKCQDGGDEQIPDNLHALGIYG